MKEGREELAFIERPFNALVLHRYFYLIFWWNFSDSYIRPLNIYVPQQPKKETDGVVRSSPLLP